MMKRVYDLASAVRSTLLCQSSNHRTARAARRLDPIIRDALTTTLQENECQTDLDEIETELALVNTNLQQAIKKEQFLGLRSRHYRQLLDIAAKSLREEREELKIKERAIKLEADEEADTVIKEMVSDWERRMEKWEKDEDALQSIQATHTQILANIEEMRRTIRKLEQKKVMLRKLNDQCQEFIAAAAEAASNKSSHEVRNGDEDADLELTAAPGNRHGLAACTDVETQAEVAKDSMDELSGIAESVIESEQTTHFAQEDATIRTLKAMILEPVLPKVLS
jgi:DNA repair exonuclease SbcCD ATPase subunit